MQILTDDNDFESICALDRVDKRWHEIIVARDEEVTETAVITYCRSGKLWFCEIIIMISYLQLGKRNLVLYAPRILINHGISFI